MEKGSHDAAPASENLPAGSEAAKTRAWCDDESTVEAAVAARGGSIASIEYGFTFQYGGDGSAPLPPFHFPELSRPLKSAPNKFIDGA